MRFCHFGFDKPYSFTQRRRGDVDVLTEKVLLYNSSQVSSSFTDLTFDKRALSRFAEEPAAPTKVIFLGISMKMANRSILLRNQCMTEF